MLIREYKKCFKKSFYKMEQSYVSEKTDVLNKNGMFTYFQGDELNARRHWQKALDMNPQHEDSLLNSLIFDWRTGFISDEEAIEKLHAERDHLNHEKFSILEGLLKVAMGEKADGVAILKKHLFEESKEGPPPITFSNLGNGRREERKEMAARISHKDDLRELFQQIQLRKDSFL